MADNADEMQKNQKLEEEVKRMGDMPLHPVVDKIHQRFGIFNLIRNKRNAKQVDIGRLDDPSNG